MDGVNLLPDDVANDWRARVETALADEWALVKRSRNRGLIQAHARLHYLLADLGQALGVSGGVQTMSGGTDKPPRPS